MTTVNLPRTSLFMRPSRRRLRSVTATTMGVIVTLFLLITLTFVLGRVLPLDPVAAVIGDDADQATYDMIYHQLGLDRPIWEQFAMFVGRMLTGDFGTGILTNRPVLHDIVRVFPATFELATFAIILGAGVGVPLGVLAGTNHGKLPDHIVRVISLLGYSTPVFWLGLMGLLLFYANLGWVGASGRMSIYYQGLVPSVTGMVLIDSLLAGEREIFWNAVKHIILPASVLGYNSVAIISRMTRNFMLEQMSQEYLVAAQAKGVPRRQLIWRHAFPNIRVQVITIVALSYAAMLEGAVLVETVFAWPGFGLYLTNALLIGDMNVVTACTLIVGVIFISLNLLSDILYRLLDPRTR